MNHYELTVILDPNLSEGDVDKISTELSGLLSNSGATNIMSVKTERRAFAYPIRKHREGTYIFIGFNAPVTVPEKIRRELLHREEILRLAFFRLPEKKMDAPQTPTTSAPVHSTGDQPSTEVKNE